MITLKLHTGGKEEDLKYLKKWFEEQVQKIKTNNTLSGTERSTQLTQLKKVYEKEKKELDYKLY